MLLGYITKGWTEFAQGSYDGAIEIAEEGLQTVPNPRSKFIAGELFYLESVAELHRIQEKPSLTFKRVEPLSGLYSCQRLFGGFSKTSIAILDRQLRDWRQWDRVALPGTCDTCHRYEELTICGAFQPERIHSDSIENPFRLCAACKEKILREHAQRIAGMLTGKDQERKEVFFNGKRSCPSNAEISRMVSDAVIVIDEDKYSVGVENRPLPRMGKTAWDVFVLLYKNCGRVCSDPMIKHAVWPEVQDLRLTKKRVD